MLQACPEGSDDRSQGCVRQGLQGWVIMQILINTLR